MAVRQQNLDKFNEMFWKITNPQDPLYGEYLTSEELTDMIGPDCAVVDKLLTWLEGQGIEDAQVSQNKDFIHFSASVEQVSNAFAVKMYVYKNSQTGKEIIRTTLPYSVPEEFGDYIDFVVGIKSFPIPPRKTVPASPDTLAIGPAQLRQRYNVTALGGDATTMQAVAEFQDQFYSPADLQQFFTEYVKYDPNGDHVAKTEGQNSPSDPGVESSLDIQYIMGVAANVSSWFWSNPSVDFWSDLTSWVSQIEAVSNPPQVHSVSYGSQGDYPSDEYRQRLNTEFQKLGIRGLSIIFASGDSGTGCFFCVEFLPSFPATSPYVTSVGATRFINNAVGPEAAVEAFGSGGGFSLLFDRPSYQEAAVEHYFNTEKDLPESFFYNAKGRGTPDVAALGIGFEVIVGGGVQSVGGTSCAAPTFSAVISLLNDLRFKQGKKSLGFLNQWLYQTAAAHPNAFYDVTVGDNQYGCCGLTGFNCAPGWDPVTGLGTPNYSVLKTLV
eukprot:TRINITY_DN6064_c0_g2_i1.p1 TRINITY_DN6064_c0_g2~~TRINITY_DN6064_c0_g2_i1.p1  ORF type:complete len:541 (+),score=103.79 TRINITY_DN6064_c0_g2_i1:136-1623(+)